MLAASFQQLLLLYYVAGVLTGLCVLGWRKR